MCLSAQSLYLAPYGSDAGNGSVDAPFATLDRATQAVRELKRNQTADKQPIVVQLRGGTYYLPAPWTLSAADSGTEAAPISYQAFPGETPVISAGRQLTGWTQPAPGVWSLTVPADAQNFENLFVNGQRRYRPRTTKNGYLHFVGPVYLPAAAPACQLQVTGKGYQCMDRFQFNAGDLLPSYYNLSDVVIDDFEKWTMSRMRLLRVDAAANIGYLTGSIGGTDGNHGYLPGHRYLVENAREALTEPGEWYLDRGQVPWKLTYLAQPGEDPASAVVVAPQLTQTLVATNLSYVSFEGLTFSHDNWVVPAAGHASTQGEPKIPAAVSFTNSSYVTLDGCIVSHTSGWGVEFVGAGPFVKTPVNRVVNSELYDLGAGGIRIGGMQQTADTDGNVAQWALVRNNTISGGGRVLPAGVGVWMGDAHNNVIDHNDIFDFYHSGVELCVPSQAGCKYPHDNVISANHVYQIGQGVTSDMGGVYTATYDSPGNQIVGNRIHDVTHNYLDADGYGGEGIYLDNLSSHVLVANNVVYRASQSTLFNNLGGNNTIANNILAFGGQGMAQRGGDMADTLSFSFTNNIVYYTVSPIQRPSQWQCADNSGAARPCAERFFFDSNLYWTPSGAAPVFATSDPNRPTQMVSHSLAEWRSLGEDAHSISQDPGFQNPSYPADDFRLKSGSPAAAIGFVELDAWQADRTGPGRTNPALYPPAVPRGFPLQSMDPVKDYGARASVASPAATVSAASYKVGPVSPESIASVWGAALATGSAQASTYPPAAALAGSSVTVVDSIGTARAAPLFYASPVQINFEVPPGTAPGPATVRVLSGDGGFAAGPVDIAPVAPALFSLDSSGGGLAAAQAVLAKADGRQTQVPVYQCPPSGPCSATPIDLGGPEDTVALILYGTGIRGRAGTVRCDIGGSPATVNYAGPQGYYFGLDQVNVILPRNLAGRGQVDVKLTVDAQSANTVTVVVK